MSERVETLRDVLMLDMQTPPEAFTPGTFQDGFDHAVVLIGGANLLDARIIRPVCPECTNGTVWRGSEKDGYADECPACHGEPAPVSIVTAEAWAAARLPIAKALAATPGALHDVDAFFDVADKLLAQALTALLGGGVEWQGRCWRFRQG